MSLLSYQMPGFWCQVPGDPAKAKRNISTIADIFQCHIRQPLQGERCRSQRMYRHSVFSWFFTTPCRIQPICLYFACRNYVSPIMVELWGTAPQSKTTIPQRIQNHHHSRDMYIINI